MTDPSTENNKSLPAWKIALAVVSLVCVAAGFGLRVMSEGASSSEGMGAGEDASDQALVEGQGGSGSSGILRGSDATSSDYSQLLVKGGFSFFVAFCVGYALRTFFKISLVALGFLFLVLFALSYFKLIQVDWNLLEQRYDQLGARLTEQLQAFKSFIEGSLPAAGLAAVGLVIGFKRK